MKRTLIPQVVIGLVMLLYAYSAAAQSTPYTPESPVVNSAQMPLFPVLARQARIEGAVQVKVTTDGTSITKITASGAHKILLDAAEENVRTWKLYRHKPQTFTVTFVYKLESPEVNGFVNPTVLLELPSRVEVRTKMPMAMP
jgi:Gram-negative bacterial TonB protein C-terminal